MEKRLCKNCEKPIEGRRGKKFCDAYCRSNYHNKNREEDWGIVREVNKKLRNNWKILKLLNPHGRTIIRKEYLRLQGYDFNYFTNVYKTKKNRLYYFCYDLGITETDEVHISIVNWQSYMNNYETPISKSTSK
jgi:hypothetical protein